MSSTPAVPTNEQRKLAAQRDAGTADRPEPAAVAGVDDINLGGDPIVSPNTASQGISALRKPSARKPVTV